MQLLFFWSRARHKNLILKEAIEMELYPSSLKREDGFYLSRAWQPLFPDL
jgi:hypothetical protein